MKGKIYPFLSILVFTVILFSCNMEEDIRTYVDDLQSKMSIPSAKIKAAQKLAEIGNTEALPYLVKALDNDPQVRRAVEDSISTFGELAIPELTDGLSSPSETIRTSCIDLLTRLGAISVDSLRSTLSSDDTFTKMSAIQALGEIGDKKALFDLIGILRESEENMLIISSCDAIAKMKATEAKSEIIKLLNHDSNDIKKVAVKALRELNAEDTIDLLIKYLDKSVNQVVRLDILDALIAFERTTENEKKVLIVLMVDNNYRIRHKASIVLYRMGVKRVIVSLLEDLSLYEQPRYSDEKAIISTLDTLALIKDNRKKTINEIRNRLIHDNDLIKLHAARALYMIDGESGMETILNGLSSKFPETQERALYFIEELELTGDIESLKIFLTSTTDISLKLRSIEICRKLGIVDIFPILLTMIQEEDTVWQIKEEILLMAKELNTDHGIKILNKATLDKDLYIQNKAKMFLSKMEKENKDKD